MQKKAEKESNSGHEAINQNDLFSARSRAPSLWLLAPCNMSPIFIILYAMISTLRNTNSSFQCSDEI